jgi:hypothetical protein
LHSLLVQASVQSAGQRCPHGFKSRLHLKHLKAVAGQPIGHNLLKPKQNHGVVITGLAPCKIAIPRFKSGCRLQKRDTPEGATFFLSPISGRVRLRVCGEPRRK